MYKKVKPKKKSNSQKKSLYILLLVVLITSSLPIVHAATNTIEVEDSFKINKQVNYAKPCFNNGTYCSSSASCNFTILNQDNEFIINNRAGTNNNSLFNITFTPYSIGIFTVNQVCCDTTGCGSETYHFQVTGSGYNDTSNYYWLILAIGFGIMVFGFFIKDGWVVILGTIGLYIVGLLIIIQGIDFIKDTTTTWGIGLIILSLAGYISINSAMEMLG